MTVHQLLIGKSVAYGVLRSGATITTVNEINDLANGAVAFFGADSNLISTAAGFLDQPYFFIAVGGSTSSKTRLSKRIMRRNSRFYAFAYEAPVNERIFLGDDGSAAYDVNLPSLTAGQVASICIEEFTEINLATRKVQNFEYVVRTGDTKAIVLTALIALINARTDGLCTATGVTVSGANAGIKLDVVSNSTRVKVSGRDILNAAPVITKNNSTYSASNAIAYKPGVGTAAQILDLEKKALLNEGDGNTVAWKTELFSYTTQTDESLTYKQYVINYDLEGSYPAGKHFAVPQAITLAIPTGSSQITTIETLFAAAMAVGTAASAPESGSAEENETIVS